MNSNRDILSKFICGDLGRLEQFEALYPVGDDVSQMLVAVTPGNYSASAIAKAVEDCDVQLLGLSVTAMYTSDGRPLVALRIGAASTDGVERSLARYGYEVIHARPADDEATRNRAMERANELLHILEI